MLAGVLSFTERRTCLHAISEVYVSGTWEVVICGPNEEAQFGLGELPHLGQCYDHVGDCNPVCPPALLFLSYIPNPRVLSLASLSSTVLPC